MDMGILLNVQDAEKARDALVLLMSRTIELTVQYCHRRVVDGELDQSVIPIHTGYEAFAQWFKDRSLRATGALDCIITLNYDTIIDYVLICNEVGFTYGCPWTKDLGQDKHKLIKLHGSVNWGLCPNCNESIVEMNLFGHRRDQQYRKAVAADETGDIDWINMAPATTIYSTQCPKCRCANFEPFIVPPTWNKVSYNVELLRHVWQIARMELEQASRLFIIGYSLPSTDSFFKYLLALGLSKNNSLQEIILIDPAKDENSLRERYLDFIARFFGVDNFSFWNVPFSTGAKALEYLRKHPGISYEEALDAAGEFTRRNRIRVGYTRPENLAMSELIL